MPEVFDHFLRQVGTSAAEQLDLRPLDPAYRVLFEGYEEELDVRASAARNADLFERIEPGAGLRLARYLDSAASTYDMTLERFLFTSFTSQRALLAPAVLAGLLVPPYLVSTWPFRSLPDDEAERAHRGWRRFLRLNLLSGFLLTQPLLVRALTG